MGADFISHRSGDRLGLILFGSNAYVQSPLSFDTATVKRFLLEAQIGFAGQETAIGDAIGLAVKRLKERPAESRVLILLTDGQDTASSVRPLDAAQLAAGPGHPHLHHRYRRRPDDPAGPVRLQFRQSPGQSVGGAG